MIFEWPVVVRFTFLRLHPLGPPMVAGVGSETSASRFSFHFGRLEPCLTNGQATR